jgi:AraC-like DNA-binding protein
LSLLSVCAAIIIAIRAQHARRLTERDEARQERKRARQDATDATGDATQTRQAASREEFVTAWRGNGHQSIAALAQELGVNIRTAQRWVKDKTTTEATQS